MRALAACAVVLGLIVSPTITRAGGPGDKDSANKAGATNGNSAANATSAAGAPAPAAAADAAAKAEPSSMEVESELRQMRDLLEAQAKQLQEQQQKMNQLEERLKASQPGLISESPTATAAPAAGANIVATPAATADAGGNQAKAKVEEKLSDLAYGKVKIGATFYGDYSHFNNSGFGPAFSDTPLIQLGPGNNGLNAFDVTRAYINIFYTPNDHVTLRITPDIYRQVDNTDGAVSNGNGSQLGGTENGSLTFRLKYAYVDFQNYFGEGAFAKDKITFGQTQNPLIDWEEGLSGHRYTYLVPWNYLSLSSTYTGARLHGPIEFNGREFLDYDLGVFTTASFHAIETNDKKQFMGRLTWYPLGTTSDRTGFGVTIFENYGYNTKFPSQVSTPLNRIAILGHYQSHNKAYEIAGEYDLGHNALSTGNLFSGAAPVAGGPFNAFNTLAGTLLAGTHTRQQGFAFFGHARLGNSPFSLFGFYQYFQPNTRVHGDDPIDFSRTVGGISYKVTDHFDVAFGDENFHWLHQALVAGGDTNAIAVWTQFNY